MTSVMQPLANMIMTDDLDRGYSLLKMQATFFPS